jgi:hypothetical protein
LRAYIAGPLTPRGENSRNYTIDYEYNKNQMIVAAVAVLKAGHSPFCPALDAAYFLVGGTENRITEAQIKRSSMDFLDVCECVVLCPGWKRSSGTLAEIKRAEEMGIPVFKSLRAFMERDDG